MIFLPYAVCILVVRLPRLKLVALLLILLAEEVLRYFLLRYAIYADLEVIIIEQQLAHLKLLLCYSTELRVQLRLSGADRLRAALGAV